MFKFRKLAVLSFVFFLLTCLGFLKNAEALEIKVPNLIDSDGNRSLRQSIADACLYPGDDTISFNIDYISNFTLTLSRPLEIPENCKGKITVQGTIHDATYGNRRITLDASRIPENQCAVKIAKNPSSTELQTLRFAALREQVRTGEIPQEDVKATVFSGFNIITGDKRDGVCVSGEYVEVSNNVIGFKPAAAVPQGNAKMSVGIRFDSHNGKISGNTISYTSNEAIRVSGSDNLISNNTLGLMGPAASPAEEAMSEIPGVYPNNQAGNEKGITLVTYATRNNVIGNKISYSRGAGIEISNAASYSNKILNTSFYHNGGKGIALLDGANHAVPAPVIKSITPATPAERGNFYYWNVQIEGRTGAQIQIFKAEEEDNDHGSGEGSQLLRFFSPLPLITSIFLNPDATDASRLTEHEQTQVQRLVVDTQAGGEVASALNEAAQSAAAANPPQGQTGSTGATGTATPSNSTTTYTFVVMANKEWFPNRQGKITATQTTGDGTSEFSRNRNLDGSEPSGDLGGLIADGTNIAQCLLSQVCRPLAQDPNNPAPVLTLVGVSGATVNLSWTFTPISGQAVSHFVLERGILRENNSCDGFDFHIVGDIPATATSYSDSDRDPAQGNCYRLRAMYEASSSSTSNIVRTNGVPAPTGLTTSASGSSVTGSFTHAGAAGTQYDVQRAAVDRADANCAAESLSASYQNISLGDSAFTREASRVSFTQTNVPAGNYCYRVRARTGAGANILTSGWNPAARPVTVGQGTTTGPNPRINNPTVDSGGHVVITFTDNTDDETGFKVERADGQCSASSNFSTVVCNLPASPGHGSALSCTDNTAERGKTYCYRVTAIGPNVSSTITYTVPRVDANNGSGNRDSLDTSIGQGGGGCALNAAVGSAPSMMMAWIFFLALPVLRLRKIK